MGKLYIEGAGFSMESATERTPDPSLFYIYHEEQIVSVFDSRDEAQAEYRRRCEIYWNTKLMSRHTSDRLMGARGLLALDKSNLEAWYELARNGNQSEKTKAAFWIRKLEGQPVGLPETV